LKLAIGHAESLVRKKVDYIFMPSVHGKGICVYMQKAPQIISACLELKEKQITLLAPDICVDQSDSISKAYLSIVGQLGHGRISALPAIIKGGIFEITKHFTKRKGKLLPILPENEAGFVLVSRHYGLSDPILSLSIKQKLNDLGYKVFDLPQTREPPYTSRPKRNLIHDQYNEKDLYWPFGRDVLTEAKQLRDIPNLYPIYLTYHGCGPDTMLAHWFDNEMGIKPYLSIEVDEHSSHAGVLTRIEAFANSVSKRNDASENISAGISVLDDGVVQSNFNAISKAIPLAIPSLYPYSTLLTEHFRQQGYNALEMPATTKQSHAKGQTFMHGKENFSLTALLGDYIEFSNKATKAQILLLQNIGAENEGVYSRFIATKMREQEYENVIIISPLWERLLGDKKTVKALFSVLLSGDILLCASKSRQTELLIKMRAVFANGLPKVEDFIKWAQVVASEAYSKFILCAGETACFLNSLFRNEMEMRCETAGYTLRYAPLSELLLLEMMEIGVWAKQKAALLRKVSRTLGFGSPFAESIKTLSKTADSVLGSRAEMNGRCDGCSIQCGRGECKCRTLSASSRWQAGKAALLSDEYYGLIRTASMYENTSSIFSLIDNSLGAKCLDFRFEGMLSSAEAARVDTWLHYLSHL
jgi:predicted nucleotide-binding protein (sugar kinase/HSP70/actin superfamily)